MAGQIIRLDATLVNRIAAGEVIQRPANALKELIENSLDASATNIQITIKEGGLKLLQIQDDGTGIRHEDFAIVCERFTTSKLRNFEDLQSIATYGFRGEALASISHVAHLTIVSKTADSICAYRAEYLDGKLRGDLKPIAGNQGTLIVVEDLFYNMAVRKMALRSPTEEYQKICDVVSRYALHNHQRAAFTLRRCGQSSGGDHIGGNVDVKTHLHHNGATINDTIRNLYGNAIAKELLQMECSSAMPNYKLTAVVTNANYSTKKFTFILFINHRLVDCQNLKRRVDQVYSSYLPKNGHPFVYMSLELAPESVDVNVHPTKHEVHFLNEEQIVDDVAVQLDRKLLGSNESRVFYAQAALPNMDRVGAIKLKAGVVNTTTKDGSPPAATVIADKNLVRTDSKAKKLDSFLSQKGENVNVSHEINRISDRVLWSGIRTICDGIERDCHPVLRTTFAQHVFVGAVDPHRALIQYDTKLFLCNSTAIMQELFFQLAIMQCGLQKFIELNTELDIYEMVLRGLELEAAGWIEAEHGPREHLAQQVVSILDEHSATLLTCFSLRINAGKLQALPLLLANHEPDFSGLPLFILRLATEVDWDSDDESVRCRGVATETARFYARIHERTTHRTTGKGWLWITEHVLYPAIKQYLVPPKRFCEDVTLVEIANLPDLYKTFERC